MLTLAGGLLSANLVSGTAAPPMRFQHLGVDEGLSNSRTYAVLRDSRGFLWIGTDDGLNRFDGSSMVVYRARLEDDQSLASSQVRALFEDGQSRLWVGAGGTLHAYDRTRDAFRRYSLEPAHGGSGGLIIAGVLGDADGRIWVGTQRGLFRVDPTTGDTVRFQHVPGDVTSLSHDSVASLLLDRRQRLYVGTRSGLNRFEADTGRFERLFQGPPSPAWLRTVNVETLLEDEAGALWLGTVGQGLLRLVPETGAVEQHLPGRDPQRAIGGSRILSLASDGKGRIYLGPEDGGLDVLDTSTGRVVHHRPDLEDPSSLSASSVTQLRFDHQGILWVGTFNGGVDYVSPFGRRFGLVTARRGSLGNPHVLAFLEDYRGDLWIGTDGGGLDHWDRRTGRFTAYRHDPGRSDSLASDAVLALYEDASHDIWVGTWAAGLNRLDRRTGRFERHRNAAAITDSVWSITGAPGGNLLLGTFDRGAIEFVPRTGEFRPLAERYPGLNPSDQVFAIAVDGKGNLWVTEPAGLVYVDQGERQVNRHPLPLGAPQALLVDSRGSVWVGTDSGGLYGLRDGKLRLRYTMAEGLPSDNISAILEDESGSLWVATTLGVARIRDAVGFPEKPDVLSFDVRDGLQGNEFKRGASLRSRQGEMFFGGQRGFNFFLPRDVRTNPDPPPVVLTGLRIFNEPVPVGKPGSPLAASTITEATSLILSYRDAVVTFEFAALDLVVPAKHRYKYRLEGFEAAWNEVGGRRFATYTNLPPGDYALRVCASNNDGLWNEQGLRLPIRVVPPFWRTWPFQAGGLLLLLGAGWSAHRWRVRRHLESEQALQARVQQALAEIKTLSGLLPICAWCKRIRADDGRWSQLEAYVRDHSEADFTHGVCPDCAAAARSGRAVRPSA